MEDIVDMKLNDVVKKIRGKRGTIVRLEVEPDDDAGRKTIAITRDRIELKDSEARSEIIERGKKADGTPYRIGVIQLPSFYMDMDGARLGLTDYKSTTRDVRRLLEEFKTKNVDAVVVDLRWNGGGSLTEAVNMTGLFIDNGPVVQVKGPDGRTQPYKDPEPGLVWEGPLVVMINKFSASASEIFAGAIQDYGRGIVDRRPRHARQRHGAAAVRPGQRSCSALRDVPNMGALKLTIQQFYRPGGDSTQNRGVVSDVELPSLTTQLGRRRIGPRLRAGVQPASSRCRTTTSTWSIRKHRRRPAATLAAAHRASRSTSPRPIGRSTATKSRRTSKTVTLNKEKFLEGARRARRRQGTGKDVRRHDRSEAAGLRNGRLRQGSARHHGRLPGPAGRQQGRRRPQPTSRPPSPHGNLAVDRHRAVDTQQSGNAPQLACGSTVA